MGRLSTVVEKLFENPRGGAITSQGELQFSRVAVLTSFYSLSANEFIIAASAASLNDRSSESRGSESLSFLNLPSSAFNADTAML